MTASNDDNNQFDFDRIIRQTFVARVRYHETVDSTNSDALEFCRTDDVSAPLLVVTSQQTAGRGRGSNQWWAVAGALTFSLVIRPAEFGLTEQLWPKTSLTSGLSICFALDELAASGDIALKWPNDVFMNRRKICGVLVEVGPRSSQTLVIGVGVNVNNSFQSAPEELQGTATSLIDVTGHPFELTDVLIAVLRQLERQFFRLSNADPELARDWRQRCALQGRSIDVEAGQRRTSGICQGIDEDGALVVLTDDGPERLFGGVVARIR